MPHSAVPPPLSIAIVYSLSEERPCSRAGGADGELDVLFDLYKTDLRPDSGQQEETINMGKFLAVRENPRLPSLLVLSNTN